MKYIETNKNVYFLPNEMNHFDFFHLNILSNEEDNIDEEKMLSAGFVLIGLNNSLVTFGSSKSTNLESNSKEYPLDNLYFQENNNNKNYLSLYQHQNKFIIVNLNIKDAGFREIAEILINDNQSMNDLVDVINKMNSSMYYNLSHH